MIDAEEWDRAVEVLAGSEQIALACHVSPDGDAVGSLLGLGLFLQGLGKKVWMSWGSPEVVVPPTFGFLDGVDGLVSPDQVPNEPEVFVALDCGDAHRLEELLPKFRAAAGTINIDHHISNPGFAGINLVDPARASTAELALELIGRMGGEATPEIATCLYAGLVTDTGRFQYSNTSPETLRAAVALREAGADHLKVAEQVFESAPFEQLRILGRVLSRSRLEDGLVYSWLMLDDLEGQGLEIAEDFIDFLKVVEEAGVALLLKQRPEGGWRVSLRARDDTDVSMIARSFGGGGHAKAAGFSMGGELEEAVARIKKRLAQGTD